MKWEKKRRGEGKKKLYFSTTTSLEGGRDRGWNTRGGRDRFCSSRD